MLLVVDNGSVYTSNLIKILEGQKTNFDILIPTNPEPIWHDYTSIILSGRRKNDKKMNQINSQIIKHAVEHDKPLLGICYGAEILALTMGGTIRRMNSLKKGMQKVTINDKNPLCSGTISVFESHSYEISRLNDKLYGIASSADCEFEIIRIGTQNVFGTQFHPEMSDDGKKIIQNFVAL